MCLSSQVCGVPSYRSVRGSIELGLYTGANFLDPKSNIHLPSLALGTPLNFQFRRSCSSVCVVCRVTLLKPYMYSKCDIASKNFHKSSFFFPVGWKSTQDA